MLKTYIPGTDGFNIAYSITPMPLCSPRKIQEMVEIDADTIKDIVEKHTDTVYVSDNYVHQIDEANMAVVAFDTNLPVSTADPAMFAMVIAPIHQRAHLTKK